MALLKDKKQAQEFVGTLTLDNEGMPSFDTDEGALMSLTMFPDVALGKGAWDITRQLQWSNKRSVKREAQIIDQTIAATNTITSLRLNRSGNSIGFYAGEQKLPNGQFVAGRHARSYTTEAFTLMRQNQDKIDVLFSSEVYTYWQHKPATVYKGKPQDAEPAVLLHKPANTFSVTVVATDKAADEKAAELKLSPCNPSPKGEGKIDEGKGDEE